MLNVDFRNYYGAVKLTRPLNVMITFISVFIGAWVGGNISPHQKLLFACISAGLICAGGNVLNDYYDIESDRINKPNRPVPSGIVKRSDALLMWALTSIGGLVISFFVGLKGVFIALIAFVFLFLYNSFFKNSILFGNITISFLTGLAFIYGGIAVGNINGAFVPAIFAFLFHFGREIIKDTEDIEGDKLAGLNTFPIKFGVKKSIYFATIIFLLLSIFTIYPYLFLGYSALYLLVVFCVDFVILYVIYSLFRNHSKYNFNRLNKILKGDMIVGLLALYLR